MGIATALGGLIMCHSPKWQCSISTLAGMLYLALKVSLPSDLSTTYPYFFFLNEYKRKNKRDSKLYEGLRHKYGKWGTSNCFFDGKRRISEMGKSDPPSPNTKVKNEQ